MSELLDGHGSRRLLIRAVPAGREVLQEAPNQFLEILLDTVRFAQSKVGKPSACTLEHSQDNQGVPSESCTLRTKVVDHFQGHPRYSPLSRSTYLDDRYDEDDAVSQSHESIVCPSYGGERSPGTSYGVGGWKKDQGRDILHGIVPFDVLMEKSKAKKHLSRRIRRERGKEHSWYERECKENRSESQEGLTAADDQDRELNTMRAEDDRSSDLNHHFR